MADIKSPEQRSQNMSRIRSKDTKPEVFLRQQLFSQGFRYRKNISYVPGHPDLYLAKYHTAIFVHGCFWHRHADCKYAYMPKSRIDFWTDKFSRNVERDQTVRTELLNAGIKCLIVWECTIRKMEKSDEYTAEILERIKEFLMDQQLFTEM